MRDRIQNHVMTQLSGHIKIRFDSLPFISFIQPATANTLSPDPAHTATLRTGESSGRLVYIQIELQTYS